MARRIIAITTVLVSITITARATVIDTVDLQLQNVSVSGDYPDPVDNVVNGSFNVPTVDPSVFSITNMTFSLSGQMGGAVWSSYVLNYFSNYPFGAGLSTSIAMSYLPIATNPNYVSSLYSDQQGAGPATGASSVALVTTYQDTTLNFPNPSGNLLQSFQTGSTADQGGYVPLNAYLLAYAGVADAYSPLVNLLAFIRNPTLEVTYSLNPIVTNYSSTDLPMGDASTSWLHSNAVLNMPGVLPPNGLPSDVLVPEPPTLVGAPFCIVGDIG